MFLIFFSEILWRGHVFKLTLRVLSICIMYRCPKWCVVNSIKDRDLELIYVWLRILASEGHLYYPGKRLNVQIQK